MCEPMTLMAIASAASSAIGLHGQNQSAKAQFAAQDQSNKAARDQQYNKSSAELGERIKQGRIERARMEVAGGEAGLQIDGSFEAAIADSFFQQDEDAGLINKQAKMDGETLRAQAKANAASVKVPSYLGAALQIGNSAASGYQSGLQIKNG